MPRTVNSEWGVSENPSPETVIQLEGSCHERKVFFFLRKDFFRRGFLSISVCSPLAVKWGFFLRKLQFFRSVKGSFYYRGTE